jgi:rod shape-determining protein MreD
MKQQLWRLGGLGAALALQAAGAHLTPVFPLVFDLPLLPVLLVAIQGELLAALLLGAAAGLATDAIAGGSFGLHGFASTLTAYLLALLARRILLSTGPTVTLAVTLGAALKQATLAGLGVFLFAVPEAPAPLWAAASVVSSALLAVLLHLLQRRLLGEAPPPRVADLRLP